MNGQGKRLKPDMTSVEKFAQSVAHLIGRDMGNRAAEATNSRTVCPMPIDLVISCLFLTSSLQTTQSHFIL